MPVDQRDILSALTERQQARRVLDIYSGASATYADWKRRVGDVDLVYSNQWSVIWPDDSSSTGLPRIPNLVQLAAEDRSRLVASSAPTIVKRPSKGGDRAKKAAEKIERILSGYWYRNRLKQATPRFALDAMFSGICAVKVLPDLEVLTKGGKRSEVFPVYTRVDPRALYPDPMFAEGPFLDNALIATEEKVRTLKERYGKDVSSITKTPYADGRAVRVIEFYSDEDVAVIAQAIAAPQSARKPDAWEWLVEPTKHNLGRCPVLLGSRPSGDGVYRGDFDSILAVLNTWNRLMTLHLDAATQRVYPATLNFEVENPEDWGPDAQLNAETQNARFEFITPPGAAYENHQLMASMYDFARAGAILPAARSGTPSQSIISAAGIDATNGQESDHVRSLQRDTIGPMLEAANELALCADEKWADVEKDITGYAHGQAYVETYTPSKDIAGDYRNEVVYGIASGLDEINQNVMLLQNAGTIISFREAREQSPLVQDPLATEKMIALEKLDSAILQGIYVGASQPPGMPGAIDPFTVVKIRKALNDGSKSLDEAVADLAPQAPVTPPAPEPALPGAPGVPGAARGQQPQQPAPFGGPPLNQLVSAPPGG